MPALRYGVPTALWGAIVTATGKRRTQRARAREAGETRAAAPTIPRPVFEPKPLPDWRWKTFPVFFALAAGGFIGLYAGIVVQAANNAAISTLVFVAFALPLGFGFSRLSTRWLLSRRLVRARAKK